MDCCDGCELEEHLGSLGIQRLECIVVFKLILGSVIIVWRWNRSHEKCWMRSESIYDIGQCVLRGQIDDKGQLLESF